MEIEYGGLKNESVLATLRQKGMVPGVDFCSLVPYLRLTDAPASVVLAYLNLGALGFADESGVTLERVLQAAAEKGYSSASVEMMLALRLAYVNQPAGNWLTAIDRVSIHGAQRDVQLHVGHPKEGLWINCCYVKLDGIVAPDSRFVFYREVT